MRHPGLKNNFPLDFKRRLALTGISALVAAWILVPIGAAWWLSAQARDLEIEARQETWAPVQPHVGILSRNVSVSMEWAEVPKLTAPNWTGIVTESRLSPGQSISSGDIILAVDGVSRVAFHSDEPFYRPLVYDSEGRDLASLRRLLTSRDLPVGSSAYLSHSDMVSIRKFAASLGVPGSRSLTAFDPAWVIYLPQPSAIVASVSLVVGTPAPVPGTDLVTLEPTLLGARIVERANFIDSSSESLPDVDSLGTLDVEEGENLVIGGVSLELSAGEGVLQGQSTEQLADLVETNALVVNGSLTRPTRPGLWALPASSMVIDRFGDSCVVAKEGSAVRVVRVELVATEGTTAIVDASLSSRDSVSLSPSLTQESCS